METGLRNHEALLRDLASAVGPKSVRTDAAALSLYATDLYAAGPAPVAVVKPASPEAVARAVRAVTAHGCSVVPRGGGLSYTEGYACEPGQSVLFDLSGLNRILEIAPDDMYVTAEAGITWKQLFDALRPHGLRLPFFGTFSGAAATIGGGLSHGALFYGSARHGLAADIVLALEIAVADGSLLHTGQWALKQAAKPVFRNFGPDTTGLFLHDGGALGIKTRVSLRLIQAPAETGYASFAFGSLEVAARALSAIARSGLAEEAYVLDPDLAAVGEQGRGACGTARGLGTAIRALPGIAIGRRSAVPPDAYTLHCVAAGRSKAAVAADLAAARDIALKHGGRAIPATMPRMARAEPFPGTDAVLGPGGARWVALNAKVAHSQGTALVEAHRRLVARHAAGLAAHGVSVTYLLSALGNHNFSFEAVFHWPDAWLPLHVASVAPGRLAGWKEPEANPEGRVLVAAMRGETLRLFREHGAASNQIGRTYPFLDALSPAPATLLRALKKLLDPQGRMNPGVLGLS